MKKIHDFSRNSPILFSLAYTLLIVLVHEAFSYLFYLFPETTGIYIVSELAFIIWPVVLVVLFGFGYIFRQRGIRATLGAGLPSYLLFGLMLIGSLSSMAMEPATEWKTDPEIFLGILMLIGVGFREEILFRGVIANAIARKYANSKKGLWITVLSSSAMFGAMHMANMLHGVGFEGALIQSLSAFGSGAYFCAIYLRGGSIWMMALLHTILNGAGAAEVLFSNGAGDLTSIIEGLGLQEVIYVALDLIIVAFLLRKSKRQGIQDRIRRLNEEAGENVSAS